MSGNEVCFLDGEECFGGKTENVVKTCEFCNEVKMCGQAFEIGGMKVHRPPGLDRCLPYRVSRRPGVGRILVAVRDIKPGELVILDRAAAVLPDNQPACLGCLAPLRPEQLANIRCSGCQLPFCKPGCAKSEAHAEECKFLSHSKLPLLIEDATKPHFIYQCIAILRIILAQKKSLFLQTQMEKLMTHNDIRRQKLQAGDALKKVCQFFVVTCGMDESIINEESVWNAYGIIETNSLGFGNLKARGIYPMVSCMSHDCAPNLFPVSNPGEAVAFRAKRRIQRGEELSIRYANFLECKLCFREELKRSWFFDCTCQRCSDPTEFRTFVSSPKCLQCSIGILCPVQPLDHSTDWKCQECGHLLTREDILQLEKEGKEIVAGIEDNRKIVEGIQELEKKFSPNYHLILVLKLKFIMTSFTEKRLNEAKVEYCQSILPILQKLEGGHSPVIGQVAMELSKIEISLISDDLKAEKITNEEYLKKIRPHILLQMEAKKWAT